MVLQLLVTPLDNFMYSLPLLATKTDLIGWYSTLEEECASCMKRIAWATAWRG